jgi:hypothetical protein
MVALPGNCNRHQRQVASYAVTAGEDSLPALAGDYVVTGDRDFFKVLVDLRGELPYGGLPILLEPNPSVVAELDRRVPPSATPPGGNFGPPYLLPRVWLDIAGGRAVDSRRGPDLASPLCGAARPTSQEDRVVAMYCSLSSRNERLVTPTSGVSGGRSAPLSG